MAIIRAQVAFQMDSLLPRDAVIFNPHFDVTDTTILGEVDAQSIANDLRTAITTWSDNNKPVKVKIYTATGPPPHYPLAEASNTNTTPTASAGPREVSCCLSYYATRNIKRFRGRLYVPGNILPGGFGVRPSPAQMERVMNLAPILSTLGGANVDWVVWSRLDQQARKVTNVWCDNEWDTVRSRGMRGTSREMATTPG
jgi:hypothetical protein